MCSYIVEKAALVGSAKGRKGWMRIDTANVYFDHPYHSTLDHVLAIDFTNEGEGGRDRVAVELSADSARALVTRILAALASGDAAHGSLAPVAAVAAEQNAAKPARQGSRYHANPASACIRAPLIDEGKRPMKMLAYLLAIICVIAAAMYYFVPAGSLPTMVPGYIAGSSHIHTTHAIAAAMSAVVLFAIGWLFGRR
jgi:hypothetical protein